MRHEANVVQSACFFAESIELRAQSASASDYEEMPSGSQLTLGYNSARIQEATGNLQQAATEYKNILQAFPGRSSCISGTAVLHIELECASANLIVCCSRVSLHF